MRLSLPTLSRNVCPRALGSPSLPRASIQPFARKWFFSLEGKPVKQSLLREGDWAGIITMAIGLAALQ
jgi:hypothetical protein